MADSYVCSGAIMRCTMGNSTARLTVLPVRTVHLTGKPMANISDHLTMANLAPFGTCRSMGFPATASATAAAHGVLTPMPCVHNTPMPWMGGKLDYIVHGQPALLKSSKCQCMWGGTISLITDGQTPTGPADVSKQPATNLSGPSGDWKEQDFKTSHEDNNAKQNDTTTENKNQPEQSQQKSIQGQASQITSDPLMSALEQLASFQEKQFSSVDGGSELAYYIDPDKPFTGGGMYDNAVWDSNQKYEFIRWDGKSYSYEEGAAWDKMRENLSDRELDMLAINLKRSNDGELPQFVEYDKEGNLIMAGSKAGTFFKVSSDGKSFVTSYSKEPEIGNMLFQHDHDVSWSNVKGSFDVIDDQSVSSKSITFISPKGSTTFGYNAAGGLKMGVAGELGVEGPLLTAEYNHKDSVETSASKGNKEEDNHGWKKKETESTKATKTAHSLLLAPKARSVQI